MKNIIGKGWGTKDGTASIPKTNGSFGAVFKGTLTFFVAILLLALILALLYTKTNISQGLFNGLKLGGFCLTLLVSGYITGRKSQSKGLIHGCSLGIVVFCLTLIATLATHNFALFPAIFKGFLILLFTSLGGVLGVR